MLKSLRILNCMAWQDTGMVELAPLTVLFGANSSGKSSINHFLMMLRQTVRSPDRNSVFDFGDVNAAVQLGSFREVLFRHDLSSRLSFLTDWELDTSLSIRDPRSGKRYAGNRLALFAQASQPASSRASQSEGFRYELSSDGRHSLSVSMERDERRTNRWRLQADQYDLIRNPGRAWELPKPIQFYGFPDEAALYFQNTAFLADLELTLQEQLEHVRYLGPLRSNPERLYSWTGNQPEDVGWQGATTVAALLSGDERRFNWTEKARTKSLQVVVAEWLQKLGLLQSFSVAAIAPDRDLYEVRVKTGRRSEEVVLTDVGFGVAQVLPVVVESFYAAPGSVVLMEQPEIHLHPAVQAALADMFIAAISAREHGRRRRVQFILESHSEHLLQRLQRRIAERTLSESDVALYFCRPGPNGSQMERLEIDAYGDIANWPPDFFGSEMEDVLAQAKKSVERRMKDEATS